MASTLVVGTGLALDQVLVSLLLVVLLLVLMWLLAGLQMQFLRLTLWLNATFELHARRPAPPSSSSSDTSFLLIPLLIATATETVNMSTETFNLST